MAGTWDELVMAICRPPRDAYTPADLVGGVAGRFSVGGRSYTREDFAVRNPRGHLLQLSLYEPAGPSSSSASPNRAWNPSPSPSPSPSKEDGGKPVTPVVVYCHCNSGSRRDAEEVLHVLLPRGLAVLAFDFAGSGVSEGEYVTLGAHEVDDLAAAISALRARRGGPRLPVALWGRSMGAATALLASAADPRIAALVLDSPFASLPDLLADLAAAQRLPLPRALTRAALALMRRSVSKRAGFDVSAVVPAARAATCFAPALFGHAPGDEFIPIAHTRRLVSAYAGDAACVEFEGGHNSVRPPEWYASGLAFLAAVLLDGRGCGGDAPGGSAPATGAAVASSAPPPPPRPFAARGGRLPEASAADLAASAAFFEAACEGGRGGAGPSGIGHVYGGPALAAAHAGSEAVAGGHVGALPASETCEYVPSRRRGGGPPPAHDAHDAAGAAAADRLASALQGGLAVSRPWHPTYATPPRSGRDDAWPPAIGGGGGGGQWPPSASASPSPARATAGARTPASTATATPSPVRSHFKVPSPVRQGGGAATPASAQKQLTPQQEELGAFFGKTPTPPRPGGSAGHHRSPRAVAPVDGAPALARQASSERAARYAAAAAAEAARAARRAQEAHRRPWQ